LNPSAVESPEEYMRLALRLAARASGRTSPNPQVGAVIVREGRIVGKGYHQRAGAPHAEINALADAGSQASGADLYINLEPCSHYGRTPPCAHALIESGIRKVFVGMLDPNPLVNGKGVTVLRDAGLSVRTGILEEQCRKLNEFFIKFITTKLPFVILKAAASLDGRIAAKGGEARWITNEDSRQYVHRLRNQVDAVLVGIGTVSKDDPQLTTRLKRGKGKDAIRVIIDSTLKIRLDARVLNLRSHAPTIIATTPRASRKKIKEIEQHGGRVMVIPSRKEVDLGLLLRELGNEEVTSVLIEGGTRINTSALGAGIVDKVILFYAPRIMGGRRAPLMVTGEGVSRVEDALLLHRVRTRKFGDDVMIEGYVKKTG
jgi:diaminohydroxyphosphoribosylaminopyrimidine deaminase / 5-amino-6-(5-phosphoribosylamino)uracil reductase